ncbi:hypothetical protein LIN78_14055 [Leeia sp. TBRC 13508]|uniref:Uncharacterized protein n=1 Tax=Leeia speluncae TaxID=2884804 RepID=A0ABS8D970_9NEIS|nr:hypothetical protein [Leeia speluncae]MCB6184667.1 hypothetical protein [Leeia speluncae]
MESKFKIMLTVVLVSVFVLWLLGLGAIEYNKTGRCYKDNRVLSDDELKARWFRYLIKKKMEEIRDDYVDSRRLKFFIVNKTLGFDDQITLIKNKQVFDFNGIGKKEVKEDEDIDKIGDDSIKNGVSFIVQDPINFFSFANSEDIKIYNLKNNKKIFNGIIKKYEEKTKYNFNDLLLHNNERFFSEMYVYHYRYGKTYLEYEKIKDDSDDKYHNKKLDQLIVDMVEDVNDSRIVYDNLSVNGPNVYYVVGACGNSVLDYVLY